MITVSRNERGKSIGDCERVASFHTWERAAQWLREHGEWQKTNLCFWTRPEDVNAEVVFRTGFELLRDFPETGYGLASGVARVLAALVLMLGMHGVHAATNSMGYDVVHISTPGALWFGYHCASSRMKIDAAGMGDSFGFINSCTTWEVHPAAPQWGHGLAILSLNVTGQGIYRDCLFLDSDQGIPGQTYIEFECWGAFEPQDMFGSGFENG